jgi:hypothetical protein
MSGSNRDAWLLAGDVLAALTDGRTTPEPSGHLQVIRNQSVPALTPKNSGPACPIPVIKEPIPARQVAVFYRNRERGHSGYHGTTTLEQSGWSAITDGKPRLKVLDKIFARAGPLSLPLRRVALA